MAVVCLRALGLGDILTAVPALRALAAAFPAHRRVLAAPATLAPIVDLLEDPWEIADVRGLDRPLPPAARGADVAVNLHGRGPESHRLLLASEPRQMITFACREAKPGGSAPGWRAGEHEVRRWCRLLAESGIPADPTELRLEPSGVSSGIDDDARTAASEATVIHPGAAFPARRWPAERFAAVARREAEAGRRVLVTGTQAERRRAATVARLAGLPDRANLAGRTGLASLAALVADAGRVVCGDTGVGHLATALGTPSVLVFGPTSPAEWGPLVDRDRHRALWAGRRGDPHAERPHPGLLEIEVADVLAELDALAAADADESGAWKVPSAP